MARSTWNMGDCSPNARLSTTNDTTLPATPSRHTQPFTTQIPKLTRQGQYRHSEAGYEVWCTRLPRISEQTDAACRPDTETDSPGAVPGGCRHTQPVIQITKLTRQGQYRQEADTRSLSSRWRGQVRYVRLPRISEQTDAARHPYTDHIVQQRLNVPFSPVPGVVIAEAVQIVVRVVICRGHDDTTPVSACAGCTLATATITSGFVISFEVHSYTGRGSVAAQVQHIDRAAVQHNVYSMQSPSDLAKMPNSRL